MKSTPTLCAVAAVALLAWTPLAQAQGTSGGTGAVASIPSSVVRAEKGQPVTQPGLLSIFINPTPPGLNADPQQKTIHRGQAPPPSK